LRRGPKGSHSIYVAWVVVLLPGCQQKAGRLRSTPPSLPKPAQRTAWPARQIPYLDQTAALLKVSQGTRIGAYIAFGQCTGIRTEETRALRWEHVDFGDANATRPAPPRIAVWRSVRQHGDTKTPRSRRTLGLPDFATEALRQLADHEHRRAGPVFATRHGHELDAANVRREFTAATSLATGLPASCGTPFSASCPTPASRSTKSPASPATPPPAQPWVVYRHQLRPVMEKGAQAMDQLFCRSA